MENPGNKRQIQATGEYVDEVVLSRNIEAMRNYAGFFTGAEKPVEEYCAVEQWAAVQYGWDDIPFSNLRARGPKEDPPDCEATGPNGSQWGFEVTELVDENLRKSGQLPRSHPDFNGAPIPKIYSREELIEKLSCRIQVKDQTEDKWKGGPYEKRYLIICCDEELHAETTRQWLSHHTFSSLQLLDEAYLLLPPQYMGSRMDMEEGVAIRLRLKER